MELQSFERREIQDLSKHIGTFKVLPSKEELEKMELITISELLINTSGDRISISDTSKLHKILTPKIEEEVMLRLKLSCVPEDALTEDMLKYMAETGDYSGDPEVESRKIKKELGLEFLNINYVTGASIEQKIHHVHEMLVEHSEAWDVHVPGFGCTFGKHMEESYGITTESIYNYWLRNTPEGLELLTMSDSVKKKRQAVISTSKRFGLNVVDKVYDKELNWRQAYNICARINKAWKKQQEDPEAAFIDFKLTITDKAISELRTSLIEQWDDPAMDPEDQYRSLMQAIKENAFNLIQVDVFDPFAEYTEYLKDSSRELLDECK